MDSHKRLADRPANPTEEITITCPHCGADRVIDGETLERLERDLTLWDRRFDCPRTVIEGLLWELGDH